MCERSCTKESQSKRDKTLSALSRLHNTTKNEKSGFGTWAYNSGFIAQLLSQKHETISQARAHRKYPANALKAYDETRKAIEYAAHAPLIKTA